nr:MAG TPA: hypothetical protein [Caudoviricetes sp.]
MPIEAGSSDADDPVSCGIYVGNQKRLHFNIFCSEIKHRKGTM